MLGQAKFEGYYERHDFFELQLIAPRGTRLSREEMVISILIRISLVGLQIRGEVFCYLH